MAKKKRSAAGGKKKDGTLKKGFKFVKGGGGRVAKAKAKK